LGKSDGQTDLERVVRTSRFQQGHPDIQIVAEARREHTSGRTGSDYYIIKFLSRVSGSIGH
jgi:hypothetical protein